MMCTALRSVPDLHEGPNKFCFFKDKGPSFMKDLRVCASNPMEVSGLGLGGQDKSIHLVSRVINTESIGVEKPRRCLEIGGKSRSLSFVASDPIECTQPRQSTIRDDLSTKEAHLGLSDIVDRSCDVQAQGVTFDTSTDMVNGSIVVSKTLQANGCSSSLTTEMFGFAVGIAFKRKKTPQVGENRKRSSKTEEDEVEPADTKNESQDDDDVDNDNTVPKEESDQEGSESEEEEEDETKEQAPIEKKSPTKNVKKESGSKASEKSKSVKKGTPAKSSITSAKSTKNSSSSTSMKAASNADGASESASKPKVSATKKQKVEKDSEDQSASAKGKVISKKQPSKSSSNVSAKDQGKGKASKKAKPEPSKEEMHAVVVNILKEVDFNTATLSDILRQLGTHFGVDLMHRKAEVKAVITDVINSMSDEEDEGEEADSGDDAEKDEDSDSDA
ncbi:hypothetical protein TEA_007067 [Camellia sinensis var. sinensis]|uniref:DEK-C domain-containing protein n=1 Tax=Camellia sinensis var. sinensis TaxID=542762 RepID=A0A4S4CYS3_CAMSN|nr:hypothetical protein TEA_007067 [Camellia sinensis var. sinensis]